MPRVCRSARCSGVLTAVLPAVSGLVLLGAALVLAPVTRRRLHQNDGGRDDLVVFFGALAVAVLSFVVSNEYLFLYGLDSNGKVSALDRQTGATQWKQSAGYDIEFIDQTADAVFLGSSVDDPDGGTLGRVDCFGLDGTRRWKTVTELPSVEKLIVSGPYVVAASERQFTVLDRENGEECWTHTPESYSRLSVQAEDEALYVSYLDRGAVARFPLE